MAIPDRAVTAYKTWFPLVMDAIRSTYDTGSPTFGVTDVSAAAAELARTTPSLAGTYDPIGVSQLYGAANAVARASYNLNTAAASAPFDSSMVANDLFQRSDSEMAALPIMRAVADVTYLDETGSQINGRFTIFYYNRTFPTVGSLQAHVALDVQDMLATPPPTGTPRTGQLVSVDRITMTTV